ncbi:RICIN domain-containing protein, partial [Chlorogloeopsis fritschii]
MSVYSPDASAANYYFLKVKHSGKCLHQQGGTLGNGDKITQWDCVNQPNVKVEKVPAGKGYFFLKFAHSGKCVHLHEASSENGAPITQWECVNQPNVKWREEPAGEGYSYLKSQQTGKCLHQQGATQSNGDPITQWDCVDQPNVQWKFVLASQEVPKTYYFLKVKHSGKCLHQQGGTLGNGDKITQWDCVNQPNVKVEKVPAGKG